MDDSPAEISQKQIKEANIKLDFPKKSTNVLLSKRELF